MAFTLSDTAGLDAITSWLSQQPEANIVHLSIGANDWFNFWTQELIGTQAEADLLAGIVDNVETVVDHILSIRPDAQIFWSSYDFFRPLQLATPAEINALQINLADRASQLAMTRQPELTFGDFNGLLQETYGFDGIQYSPFDPSSPVPPGHPSLPDPTLPSPLIAFLPDNRSHLTSDGYRVLAQAQYELFYASRLDGQSFQINAGLNGNWWNGLDRNGEGVQVEVADGGGGSLIFVATMYSYDTMGNQIFLIAVGPVNGNTTEVEVFITDGGQWGDDFDPALVNESQWGTGTFTASSCTAIHMALMPNAEFQGMGYTDLSYDMVRLTTPAIPCPSENPN